MKWKIYYNPKCGTCRAVLAMLESNGVKPQLIEYLKTPLSVADLDEILDFGGYEPEDIVRKKEPIYAELGLDKKKLSREEWIKMLIKNPILIERPIVVKGSRALVCHPPEKVQELF